MTDNILERTIIEIADVAVNAITETQVILQLLVKKNIVTTEEVVSMRDVVRNRPKYKRLFDLVETGYSNLNESETFDSLMKKLLTDRDSMTDEEMEQLDKMLSKVRGK